MFRRALKREIDSGKINENDMYKYDDADIISLFRTSDDEIVRDMINRLDNRIIPKRVKTIRLDNFKNPEKLYKIDQKALRKAEEEIAEDFDMDKNYVFINIAEYPRFDEMKTQVNVDEKLYPLTEISNIIGALSKARFNIPDISIYIPIEEKERFDKLKLNHYLDLPEVDREKFHGIHYDQIKLF